eukprot:CAMPEP_0176286258 /NCGR_PEP_ID=MMETSP0121_2-20121125/52810_1 /TAXON_ID=160619 /ORGANISM="Kryptoperidinium foliaceum, Strain CCMP 1326" /LENGTH=68 /DNA_ID=CAMNT_0017626803 /DNA_START=83 /DNA_END=286 /DNA_ORIENTATION=+
MGAAGDNRQSPVLRPSGLRRSKHVGGWAMMALLETPTMAEPAPKPHVTAWEMATRHARRQPRKHRAPR